METGHAGRLDQKAAQGLAAMLGHFREVSGSGLPPSGPPDPAEAGPARTTERGGRPRAGGISIDLSIFWFLEIWEGER